MTSTSLASRHLVDLGVDADVRDSALLLRSNTLKLTRVYVRSDESRATYVHGGDVLIECRKGHVVVTLDDDRLDLTPGHLLHLAPGVPHSLQGVEDSVVLIIGFATRGERSAAPIVLLEDEVEFVRERDLVEEASEESFPASDPPSWTPTSS